MKSLLPTWQTERSRSHSPLTSKANQNCTASTCRYMTQYCTITCKKAKFKSSRAGPSTGARWNGPLCNAGDISFSSQSGKRLCKKAQAIREAANSGNSNTQGLPEAHGAARCRPRSRCRHAGAMHTPCRVVCSTPAAGHAAH